MRTDRFAPLPPDAAASLYEGLAGEDDWRLILPYIPDDRRGGALAILALMRELEGVPARVSEPMLGNIRCQWWRDALGEAFGPGPVRHHPLSVAIEATLGGDPEMSPPLRAMVEGAEAVLELRDPCPPSDAITAARGVWGAGAAALARWFGAPEAANVASDAATAHAVLRLTNQDAQPVRTRSLPRLSDRLAAISLGEATGLIPPKPTAQVPDAALPAILPATLIPAYTRGRTLSPLGKRARYLAAMLRGCV